MTDRVVLAYSGGLDTSVDYFVFKQQNLLAQLSDFYGYADFFTENAKGNPLFADA